MTQTTRRKLALPCVLLVGISDAVAQACEEAIAPFPVLRSLNVEGGVVRGSVVQPLLVVIDGSLPEAAIERQRDVAVAVGAELILAKGPDDANVPRLVREALERVGS